jgi:putative holliday junction resolvase
MSIGSQNEAKISHYLGIDFGTSKVGLAVADSELKIASAYKTLDNNEKLLDVLTEIIREREIGKIILGVTQYNNQADDKKQFGELIREKLGVKVEYHNEMFTTKMAQENIKERRLKNIKELDNQEAARIILQSWLDKNF